MRTIVGVLVSCALLSAVAVAAADPAAPPFPRTEKGDYIDFDEIKGRLDPSSKATRVMQGTGRWLMLIPGRGGPADPGYLEKTVRLLHGSPSVEVSIRGWKDHLSRVVVTPEGGEPRELYREVIAGGPYRPVSIDLADYAGQTVTVRYECVANDWNFEYAGIDHFYVYQPFTPARDINGRVAAEMAAWKAKGKFETSDAHAERTSPANEAVRLEMLRRQAIADYTDFLLGGEIVVGEYDADAETYTLQLEHMAPLTIPVPLAEAPSLDENRGQLAFGEPVLAFEDGLFTFTHVEITNPANFELYVYDSGASAAPQAEPLTVFSYPQAGAANEEGVAVVIGNKDYLRTRPVEFALNDARQIKRMLVESMGYREGNIILVENANQGDFRVIFGTPDDHRGRLHNVVKPGESDVFVYYSGHGAPGLKDLGTDNHGAKGYFLPVECDPQYVELGGYAIDTFYGNLAELEARSVTVVLDACFSGEKVFDNISPVAIKVEDPAALHADMVVISASTGRQVSCWYNEQRHGLFTYEFLAGISGLTADEDSDGTLSYAELFRYVSDRSEGVPYHARRLHGVEQNPVIQGNYEHRVVVGRAR